MFKSPFSIKGRIRRTEFAYTLMIFFVAVVAIIFTIMYLGFKFSLPLIFAAAWFRIAQGAKRCHDTGVSGLYQFIPYYTVVLFFEKSKPGPNKYGENPKIGIVKGICKILLIKEDMVIVETDKGKIRGLQDIVIPKYARRGDLIQHTEAGYYIVVDKDGNLVYRM